MTQQRCKCGHSTLNLVLHKHRDALTLRVRSEEGGSLGLVGRLELSGRGALEGVSLGESDRLLVELKNLRSADVSLVENGGSNDLDGIMGS